ncbi:Complex III assembly protein translocase and chaperone, partial [Coemansia asiatica]
QLQAIIDSTEQLERTKSIGILTAGLRDDWYSARECLLQVSPSNAESLRILESSAFLVSLESVSPSTHQEFSMACHCSNGVDRYFDKNFQLLVFANGRYGFNGEHSLTDATTDMRLCNALVKDVEALCSESPSNEVSAAAASSSYAVSELGFDYSAELLSHIQRAIDYFDATVRGHELATLEFDSFGKEQIKKMKVSPDAFVQMAMQLAYYRKFGHVPATYESASTKSYARGRTETSRSVSEHSVEWCRMMVDHPETTSLHTKMVDLSTFLADNPLFSAGFGLIGVGAGLAVLRQSARRGADLMKRQLLVSIEIPSHDKSYQWVLGWLSRRGADAIRAVDSGNKDITWVRRRIAGAVLPRHVAVQTSYKQHDNGSVSTAFTMVPGQGKHIFFYQGIFIQVDRQRNAKMIDIQSAAPFETVTLTTLSRDRAVFTDILQEAREYALSQNEGRTVLYTSFGPEWRPFGLPRKRRLLDSVILDQGVSAGIVEDVKDFISNGKWYDERGIPYRRGYLLHGPPGSGKTSFIQALAGDLGYNICILNLSERGLTDDRLNHLLTVAPERSLVLLEDIDAAFNRNRQQSDNAAYQQSMVTFSGLLNALDGVASSDERIIFMTTNHIERLDPALVRPGRVDVKVYLGNATKYQICKMFTRFYGAENEKLAETFAEKLQGHTVSTAQLQGHFVAHKKDAASAIDNVASLIEMCQGNK